MQPTRQKRDAPDWWVSNTEGKGGGIKGKGVQGGLRLDEGGGKRRGRA
jgi:hypothetical protein